MKVLTKITADFIRFFKTRTKRELTFLAVGILMLIIVIGYVGVAFRFLISQTSQAFSNQSAEAPLLRFNIEKARLIQE